MNISQECQYALRAVFELAKRQGGGPVSVGRIAKVQAIPPRFLELILGNLKRSGYVVSRRGAGGGYLLAVSPRDLSVGDIIRFVDGPLDPVACIAGKEGGSCPLRGDCAFAVVWERAKRAVEGVYDNTSFGDLVEQERDHPRSNVPMYSI